MNVKSSVWKLSQNCQLHQRHVKHGDYRARRCEHAGFVSFPFFLSFFQKREEPRVAFVTYLPLESNGHRDGRAFGNGIGVCTEDLSECGPIRARRLRVDDGLLVFEAHAEKKLAVAGLVATEASGVCEGVDLQFEGPAGECLGRREGGAFRWRNSNTAHENRIISHGVNNEGERHLTH